MGSFFLLLNLLKINFWALSNVTFTGNINRAFQKLYLPVNGIKLYLTVIGTFDRAQEFI